MAPDTKHPLCLKIFNGNPTHTTSQIHDNFVYLFFGFTIILMTDWKDILAGALESGKLPKGETDNVNCNDNDADNASTASTADGDKPVLTIFYEKKGRAGKPATIITGFDADDDSSIAQADALSRTLKQRLGCGGSARGGEILLQGDRRDDLRRLLPELGYNRCKIPSDR